MSGALRPLTGEGAAQILRLAHAAIDAAHDEGEARVQRAYIHSGDREARDGASAAVRAAVSTSKAAERALAEHVYGLIGFDATGGAS